MIAAWLDDEFRAIFGRHPRVRVLLWCDEREEFGRFLAAHQFPPQGSSYVLLRYQLDRARCLYHGQLWLKAQMVWESRDLSSQERNSRRYVIYLPFPPDALGGDRANGSELDYLAEYRYSGQVWLLDGKKPSLFSFLRRHDVPLPDSPREQRALWEGGRDSLLAKFVARFAGHDGSFWQRRLDASVASAQLVGDLDDQILRVLADPDRAMDDLAARDLASEFARSVSAEFGFGLDPRQNPQQWAKEFALRLAMAEVYESYNHPADFPYEQRLPDANVRQRWLGLLRRWMRDADFAPVYQQVARAIESEHSLTDWAGGRSGRSQAFLHLAQVRWEEASQGLRDAGDSRSRIDAYLNEHAQEAQEEAGGYWSKVTGDLPGWAPLSALAELRLSAQQAEREAAQAAAIEEFVSSFAERWHLVDLRFWELCDAARQHHGLEAIRNAADVIYSHYLEETNSRFFALVRQLSTWTEARIRHCLAEAAMLWEGDSPTAVIFADALRFDLAVRLREQLGFCESALEPWVAATPTITAVGMTALLPLGGRLPHASLDSGRLQLLDGSFGDLAQKSRRIDLLRQECSARAVDLSDLLRAAENPYPDAQRLAVFSSDIDGLGSASGLNLASYLESLLRDLRLAIQKLHAWGFGQVHVVTDHGFLLLPRGGQQVTLPAHLAVKKDARYAFLAQGAVTDQFVLPFCLDTSQRVAFAPGVSCFTSPQEYVHGGLSLQELVIPHLRASVARRRGKVRVHVSLPTAEVSTLTFRLMLVGEPPGPLGLFDEAPLPRCVTVWLQRGCEEVSQRREVVLTASDGRQEESVVLFLNDRANLRQGQALQLHVEDLDAGEELVRGLQVTVARDF